MGSCERGILSRNTTHAGSRKIDCLFFADRQKGATAMTKSKEKTREELTAEIEDGKNKIRQFENREKMLRQKRAGEIIERDRFKFCVNSKN